MYLFTEYNNFNELRSILAKNITNFDKSKWKLYNLTDSTSYCTYIDDFLKMILSD